MKLLFVCESFPTSSKADFTGGVEARDFHTAKLLSQKNSVIVITNRRVATPSAHKISGINVIRVGTSVSHQNRNNTFTRIVFVLSSLLASLNTDFDLIQGSNVFSSAPAFMAGFLKQKPKVTLIHDVFIGRWRKLTPLPTSFIGEILERIILSLPWDHFICNSVTTKKKLRLHNKITYKQSVIYGGVESKTNKVQKTKKFSKPTIVFAGRLVKYKRVHDLLHAASQIKSTLPQLQLRIIGLGPEIDRLIQLSHKLNIASSVHFLGFQPNHAHVIATIKKSHLFCLPSIAEGFGLVTLEAMINGVPYVNSNIPATLELTKNGQGGLLFTPKDPEDLANKIIKLLTNKPLYRQKSREGIQLARSYDWAKMASQTQNLFIKIINKHGKK